MKVKKFLFTMCLLSSISGLFCSGMESVMEVEEDLMSIESMNYGSSINLGSKKRARNSSSKNDKKYVNCDDIFKGAGLKGVNLFSFNRVGFSSPEMKIQKELFCEFCSNLSIGDEKSTLSDKNVLLGCGHTAHLSCLANSKDHVQFCCSASEIRSENGLGKCEYCGNMRYTIKKCPVCHEEVNSILLAIPSICSKDNVNTFKKLVSKIIPNAIREKIK